MTGRVRCTGRGTSGSSGCAWGPRAPEAPPRASGRFPDRGPTDPAWRGGRPKPPLPPQRRRRGTEVGATARPRTNPSLGTAAGRRRPPSRRCHPGLLLGEVPGPHRRQRGQAGREHQTPPLVLQGGKLPPVPPRQEHRAAPHHQERHRRHGPQGRANPQQGQRDRTHPPCQRQEREGDPAQRREGPGHISPPEGDRRRIAGVRGPRVPGSRCRIPGAGRIDREVPDHVGPG